MEGPLKQAHLHGPRRRLEGDPGLLQEQWVSEGFLILIFQRGVTKPLLTAYCPLGCVPSGGSQPKSPTPCGFRAKCNGDYGPPTEFWVLVLNQEMR